MAGIDNLKPIHDTERAKELGAMGGRAKAGSRHLSTVIRDILENLDWDKTTLKNKDELKRLYGNKGWEAIVYVATTKAMAGDPQAMRWLAENGFGKNVDITTNGKDLVIPILGGATKDVQSNDGDKEAN